MAAYTRLGLSGTPTKPYGTFTKTPTTGGRSGTGYSRLSLSATPGRHYGAFTGRSAATSDAKTVAHTVKPVVTLGQFSDVDIDTTTSMRPKVVLATTVGIGVSATMTLRPVTTQARGSVFSSSIARTGSQSVKPVVTLTYLLQRPAASSPSVVPVVTLSNSVDTGALESLASHSVVPVVTLSSVVNNTTQSKSASHSLIPVVNFSTQINRVNQDISWEIPQTVIPVVTLIATREVAGDVDRIEIVSRPFGYIEISNA
jgi:hypothetical protein